MSKKISLFVRLYSADVSIILLFTHASYYLLFSIGETYCWYWYKRKYPAGYRQANTKNPFIVLLLTPVLEIGFCLTDSGQWSASLMTEISGSLRKGSQQRFWEVNLYQIGHTKSGCLIFSFRLFRDSATQPVIIIGYHIDRWKANSNNGHYQCYVMHGLMFYGLYKIRQFASPTYTVISKYSGIFVYNICLITNRYRYNIEIDIDIIL